MNRSEGEPTSSGTADGNDRRPLSRTVSRLASIVPGNRSTEEVVALGLSGFLLLASVAYLAAATNLNRGTLNRPGVGFFPTIVAGALLVAAGVDLVASLRRRPDGGPPDDASGAAERTGAAAAVRTESNGGFGDAAWRVPVLLGLLVAYLVGVGLVGHLVTAGIVCTLIVRILGGSAWWKSVVAGFAVSWASVLAFDTVLGMRLPG